MAAVWRLARTFSSLRTIAPAKTLYSRPPLPLAAPLFNQLGSFEQQNSHGSVGQGPKMVPNFLVHTSLAGLLGYGMLDVAFADGDEATAKSPTLAESAKSPALPKSAEGLDLPVSSESSALPESAKNDPPLESSPAASQHNLDDIARKDKARLEELIKSKGGSTGSYPRFTVSVKGTKVTIKFQVPPSAEIPFLIANLVSRLGVKAKDNGDGSEMILRAWDSGVAWQLVLAHPKTPKGAGGDQGDGKEKNSDNEGLCILMFRPVISSDKAEIEFMKPSSFTFEELDVLASILQYAGEQNRFGFVPRRDTAQVPTSDKTISSLEAMGVQIYGLKSSNLEDPNAEISWDTIAGYDDQKREIEDTILLALKSPEVYDDIARGTRCKFETNRPRAVLFEGPPGTGKTSCARAIANQARVPLLYVPLEIVVSKYYGESERLLGKVFSLANELQDGAIIFLDEVDSLATARDSDIHEATRRILSVLLRQIDGFEQQKKVVVIAATNRKQDLDPALLSRFDSMINFDLPDQQTREAIVAQYAKHLTKPEMSELARATEDMSGRDIRDVCQQAERNWASKIIRGQEQSSLPPLGEYIGSALKRRSAMLSVANQIRNPSPLWKKSQLDFI